MLTVHVYNMAAFRYCVWWLSLLLLNPKLILFQIKYTSLDLTLLAVFHDIDGILSQWFPQNQSNMQTILSVLSNYGLITLFILLLVLKDLSRLLHQENAIILCI